MKAISAVYRPPTVSRVGAIVGLMNALVGESLKLKPGSDWRIIRLKEFIDIRAGNIGDADPVCAQLELAISGRYAGMLFKRTFGIGIREYAMRQRLNLAAQRLRTTAKSIKEIAAEAGYQRSAELCRRFKETFHISPTSYRQTCRAAEQMTAIGMRAGAA